MSIHNVLLGAVLLAVSPLSFANVTISSENFQHMNRIDRSKDPTVDPCNDFHQYACGSGVKLLDNIGWSEVKYITEIQAVLGQHYPITRKVNQHYTEKLQIYYQTSEKAANAPLLPFLDEVKPGPAREWPILEDVLTYAGQDTNHTSEPWSRIEVVGLVGRLFSYGLNNVLMKLDIGEYKDKPIIHMSVPAPASIDTDRVIALLSSFKLPRPVMEKYFVDFVETHQYWQFLYKMYANDMLGVTTHDLLDGIFAPMKKFLTESLPEPIKLEDYKIAFPMHYYQFLETNQWQPDMARKLCNYLMFQFLLDLQKSVQPGYHLTSSPKRLALGLNYIHYKHVYLPHKQEVDKGFAATVKTLYKHFVQTVAENRLNLTDQQVQEITTKLGQLRTNIGNLPENVTESMVEEYYSILPDMDVNNFYKNELLVRRHAHLEIAICPKDTFCDHSAPLAFYSPYTNTMVFPFTALSPPLYDWSWHPVFAMSILGYAAGHELVHAIDSSNLNLLRYTPSFGEDSLQVPSINAAMTCLSQQYPTNTINERLADVVGSQLAYRTLSREFGTQPQFTTTPWQQLYFLSLAQTYCGKVSVQDYTHDEPKIRLLEIVMNSREFADAFQCPVGSNMNPEKKCSYI